MVMKYLVAMEEVKVLKFLLINAELNLPSHALIHLLPGIKS